MEKTATKKTASKVTRERIQEAYMEHMLLSGAQPASVFALAKSLKTTEAEVYTHFNSFPAIEKSIWTDWMDQTIQAIESDTAYLEYSVREKVLAFFFTWLETLRTHRSYVLLQFGAVSLHELHPAFLEGLKVRFEQYIKDLVLEGKDTTEIAERPFVDHYEKAFWIQLLFIMRFWVSDESTDFQKTDAAVEKSVNLGFDLLGKGPLDSMVDFAKFLFQNR